ncbi:COG4315 family predicted lipoprotein [Ramlibacter sp. MAHUQ-53]|uniref:COG4315 family predicted lipoprotein n=1 Tax=unclassified Ramlibacter TaxID=2617605 RepID=UPI0036455AC9
MTLRSVTCALALGALLAVPAAHAQTAPARASDGVLVGGNGMTLYTFDRDAAGSGKSVCNGQCAGLWPPLMATAADKDAGDWTVISRDDGGRQWAYKGKPLYFWVKDTKPGERTGDGVNGIWKLARP